MDKDTLLRKYLDGDLSDEEEREALHTIADDPDMRSMLRFEKSLSENLSSGFNRTSDTSVPEGFTDKVMSRINEESEEVDRIGLWEKIKEWSEDLWVPRQVQWRPAYSFVFALLVLISFSYPMLFLQDQQPFVTENTDTTKNIDSSIQQVSSAADEVMLRFMYLDDEAESMAVAGDFSNWEPVKLTKKTIDGKTVWTGLVSMSRGEHNYMFIKDGEQWVTDPLAPVHRDDGFGNKNAVIYI
ncbi:hypothetical protein [Fodinibius halophilus]|uniref:AMP-activated protein kinase glycogen-binding domain-containing protein n=1 Tax=Fodinibius halophilus TaxID=1736908 RepID=A0A6M1TIT8_9BACT|nr:hypothetical protein [Fodinibius halophilus]NGP89962.1 hypothetical protein [Fodinibius halophilus]